jgi:hypothetical protein
MRVFVIGTSPSAKSYAEFVMENRAVESSHRRTRRTPAAPSA